MVRSVEAIVFSGGAIPDKVAEIDVFFFRLPGATDEDLKQGAIETCNQGFIEKGQGNLSAINPRLEKVGVFGWRCTVDVIETVERDAYTPPVQGLDPITWGYIAYVIAGILIGWLVTKWIIYRVIVRPMEQALQDVVKSLDDIIAQKHDNLAAGYITQEYSDELDVLLEKARDDADEAGDDPEYDWIDFLGSLQLGKYVKWVVGGAVGLSILATVRAFAPRR